jgi:hypothetical protein
MSATRYNKWWTQKQKWNILNVAFWEVSSQESCWYQFSQI